VVATGAGGTAQNAPAACLGAGLFASGTGAVASASAGIFAIGSSAASVRPRTCCWISTSDRPAAWRRFHRDDLEQMPPSVNGTSPSYLDRRIDQPKRGVVADGSGIGDVADLAVPLAVVTKGECPLNGDSEFGDGPARGVRLHADNVTLFDSLSISS